LPRLLISRWRPLQFLRFWWWPQGGKRP